MKTLRYYAEFFSSKNKKYRLEIRTELLYGAQEIKLTSTPITVEYGSGGRLHFPALMSQASINVITHGPIIDLFTGSNQGVDIRIIDLDSGKTDWFGYFSPNTYSSNYNTDLDALQLEAIDTLASLENIRYNYLNGSSSEFATFKDVLLYILDKADPGRIINNVYMQKTLRLSADATTNLWSDLIIQEINFYDELDEAMNLQDVLKELMKFLGMTIIQYQDSYYIIDHAFIKADKSEFFFHNRTTGVETSVNIPIMTKNLYSDIGVHGSSANLSIGDLYNKQTIRANRLNIQSVIPDVMDDDDLINQNVDPEHRFEITKTIEKDEYILVNGFYNSKKNWGYMIPKKMVGDNYVDFPEELTPMNLSEIYLGTWWQKVADYKVSDGEPASLNEKTYLTMYYLQKNKSTPGIPNIGMSSINYDRMFLELNAKKELLLKGGYFILNTTYKMTGYPLANDALITNGVAFPSGGTAESLGGIDDTWIPCRLSIGNMYYNGEQWIDYQEYNNKVSRGYFTECIRTNQYAHNIIYWYVDQYGYRRFVNQSTYNSLPSGTEKGTESTGSGYDHKYLIIGSDIFVTRDYFYECLLKDRFFLIHRNKSGDKIFDTEKKLTNTVSYKMNLIDSEEGMAIKLPEKLIFGQLIFQLFRPNHLGAQPDMFTYYCDAFHVSDILLKYTSVNSNTADSQSDDTDLLYDNLLDTNNVQEAEDVTLYINTYKDRAAYSSVIVQRNGEYDFLDTLYNEIEGGAYIAEQLLINKLCDHYEEKRYIYENDLNRKFDFLTKIYENSLDATMLVSSMSIDYATDSCRVKLIEP